MTDSVILTVLKCNFRLLCTFHQHSLLLKEFPKISKFVIIGMVLPSGASLFLFLCKERSEVEKHGNKSSRRFYLRRLQPRFLVTKSFNSF